MSSPKVWLFLALSGVLNAGSCWTSMCPQICRCSPEALFCTRDTQLSSGSVTFTHTLRFTHLPLKELGSGAFDGLTNVSRIEISQSNSLRKIQHHAFLSLHSLVEMSFQNLKNLRTIERGAFTDLPKLRYLSISNTGLAHLPDLSLIASLDLFSIFLLEMADNMEIHSIPANSFQGITHYYLQLKLPCNGFREIHSHAFNGTKLTDLILNNNRYLSHIHQDSFQGATGPSALDVSSTELSFLPTRGLEQVRVLRARSAPALKKLPPLGGLGELEEAELTYPSHCCAFHTWRRKKREKAILKDLGNFTSLCRNDLSIMAPDSLDEQYDAIHPDYSDSDLCPSSSSSLISCSPGPDAFNPCEDLLGFSFLRCVTWLVTTLAVAGNLAVLLVLLSSQQKITVSRFLMCNLALADLCMGLYLLLIACMDQRSRQEYYNHATDWQTGVGCGVAGFLTVFASELSVFTLTVITLERWHTITHALRLHKKLRLRQVAAMMAAGWAFSLLAALLPTLGVSSYSKVSICLPMDIEGMASQVYVVVLLLFNVTSFLLVCFCYVRIYLSVQNPTVATRHGDTKLAKRMAILIFTDFLCLAPISFFAISAALRMPLITVSHSKILLVVFYPLNSLCNPVLYTLSTRGFRRDMCLLLSRCVCCKARAEFYRSQGLAAHPGPARPPRTRPVSRNPNSLRFYAYHIKMQGSFLNKGPT